MRLTLNANALEFIILSSFRLLAVIIIIFQKLAFNVDIKTRLQKKRKRKQKQKIEITFFRSFSM